MFNWMRMIRVVLVAMAAVWCAVLAVPNTTYATAPFAVVQRQVVRRPLFAPRILVQRQRIVAPIVAPIVAQPFVFPQAFIAPVAPQAIIIQQQPQALVVPGASAAFFAY